MYVTMLNGNYFVKIVGLIYFDLLAIKRSTETQNVYRLENIFTRNLLIGPFVSTNHTISPISNMYYLGCVGSPSCFDLPLRRFADDRFASRAN